MSGPREHRFTADGRLVLFEVGLIDEILPGNGMVGISLSATLGPDGKADLSTLRADTQPVLDFRKART